MLPPEIIDIISDYYVKYHLEQYSMKFEFNEDDLVPGGYPYEDLQQEDVFSILTLKHMYKHKIDRLNDHIQFMMEDTDPTVFEELEYTELLLEQLGLDEPKMNY
jgi:hypothetical protein